MGVMRGWKGAFLASLGAILAMSASACLPNTTVFQSGRTLQKGEYEVTGYASTHTYRVSDDQGNSSDPIDQTNFGLQGGVGVSEKADLRLQYSYTAPYELRGHSFELGPKISLLPEQLSVYIPLQLSLIRDEEGNNLSGFDDTAILIPTLLASFEVVDQIFEVNPGVRIWLPVYRDVFDDGYDWAVTLVLGFGASANLSKFVIRPEFNFTAYRIDGDSFSTQTTFGLGVSLGSKLFQER
ncbi:MAG: hypothetical protein VX475_01995 [Myxococcota bacterium]|jgi:hypothetical protein|nr:hypothetical protein [Myxococcota bacterium]